MVHSGLDAPRASSTAICRVLHTGWPAAWRQEVSRATDPRNNGDCSPSTSGKRLSQFDVEERFKWAEIRQTTHEEDWAYCLLGIFGIFMPLIYGEGKVHAVRRLKKEISEAMN